MWTLQKLQGDASLFQVFYNNIELLCVGLGVEVSQEHNVETITLLPPEKKPQTQCHIVEKQIM